MSLLYYLESYVASSLDDVDTLLKQNVYEQELLKLNEHPIPKEINGVILVDSVSMLNDIDKLNIVKSYILD